jgi:D-beta-D-heptose 7-phosphate kinase/D-beta-D-heptose 1-phosphate adenosyltransferase
LQKPPQNGYIRPCKTIPAPPDMNPSSPSLRLPDFRTAKVLVAGDLILDRYWHGGTSRISPEAPVPVVHVKTIEERLGGAGNVALNLAALGAVVSLIGYGGEDDAADSLARLLASAGIAHRIERVPGLATITKLRVLSRHQQLIRMDFEDSFEPVPEDGLVESFREAAAAADLVVLSDYGKGTLRPVARLIEAAGEAGKPVLIDPKGRDFAKYRGATLITPNLGEFEAVAGACRNEDELVEKGSRLMEVLQLDGLLVTRGEHGMSLLSRSGEPLHLATHAQEVYDVTGAGDTVIATLAGALAAGWPLPEATRLANIAAGIVVGKLGTATVDVEELAIALHGTRAQHRGVIELLDLLPLLAAARRNGERIVLTNGCFDILHPGHVHYLQQARELGDRLVVLVNSDASVQRLKGEGRPINPLPQRMAMLAALECVDWVLPFEGDTPREEICRLLPDVLVKGGDYTDITAIAGHDCVLAHGGEVKVLSFVKGFSTTNLIKTIRSA